MEADICAGVCACVCACGAHTYTCAIARCIVKVNDLSCFCCDGRSKGVTNSSSDPRG